MSHDLQSVGFCGLHCGTCYLKNGRIVESAAKLLTELEDIQFDRWGPSLAAMNPRELGAFLHASDCLEALRAWSCMRCSDFCRNGGGSAHCAIRDCCRDKGYSGCWDCADVESCETIGALLPINGSLNMDNIRRIIDIGVTAFAEESEKSNKLGFYREPR